jgi:hypothetical protein
MIRSGCIASSASATERIGATAEYLKISRTPLTAAIGLPSGQIALTCVPRAENAAASLAANGHQVVVAIAILDSTAKHIRHGFRNSISEILTKSSICKSFTRQARLLM